MEDEVCIVTGGSTGIGREVAHQLDEEGATVRVVDVDTDTDREVVDQLEGTNAAFHELDVRDHVAFEEVVEAIVDELGRVDVLVNNAGITQDRASLEDTPIEQRDRVMDVNFSGVWNGCRAVLPEMKRRGEGSIVNVGSIASFLGLKDDASYCASKAAVLNLTRAIATEVGDYGIRVNAVCPGFIDTNLAERSFQKHENPEQAREDAEASHVLSRLGRPEEIADSIVFLASENASFITGHGLIVDGGYSIK